MNNTTRDRYDRETDGTFCIDVAADRAEELYNNFDRNAPVIRRDLDQNNHESARSGVNIAAWVSLWEALATFLVEWFPHRSQIRLFRKLAQARLVFR